MPQIHIIHSHHIIILILRLVCTLKSIHVSFGHILKCIAIEMWFYGFCVYYFVAVIVIVRLYCFKNAASTRIYLVNRLQCCMRHFHTYHTSTSIVFSNFCRWLLLADSFHTEYSTRRKGFIIFFRPFVGRIYIEWNKS